MNYIKNFDDFLSPNNLDFSDIEYIRFQDLEPCSFVVYVIIPTINGEIDTEPPLVGDYNFLLSHYKDGEHVIYAINYLDFIIKEVLL